MDRIASLYLPAGRAFNWAARLLPWDGAEIGLALDVREPIVLSSRKAERRSRYGAPVFP